MANQPGSLKDLIEARISGVIPPLKGRVSIPDNGHNRRHMLQNIFPAGVTIAAYAPSVWVHWTWIWDVHMYVRFGEKSLTPVASATAVLTQSAEKIAIDKHGVHGNLLTAQRQ